MSIPPGRPSTIDRGFRSGDIDPQVREVQRVKRRQHGIVVDPYTIGVAAPVADAVHVMRRTGVGTLVVVDDQHADAVARRRGALVRLPGNGRRLLATRAPDALARGAPPLGLGH